MHSSEVHKQIIDLYPKLADLKRERDGQAAKVDDLERSLIDGVAVDSLASEQAILKSLTAACDTAQSDAEGLVSQYETAILEEIGTALGVHLNAAVEEAGTSFDNYIKLRSHCSIYGKSKDDIARDLIGKLNLNYASERLRELFHARFDIKQHSGIQRTR